MYGLVQNLIKKKLLTTENSLNKLTNEFFVF